MLHRISNVRTVSGTIAFLAMLAAPGAYDGGKEIMCIVLVAVFAGCAHLAMREDGKINRPHALDGRRGLSTQGISLSHYYKGMERKSQMKDSENFFRSRANGTI